ncbi:MAG: hypothetical protein Q8P41_07100 [Pseudomonadota bacterium]|nr:hypothetical protein [Pseudomonadota bacterium]
MKELPFWPQMVLIAVVIPGLFWMKAGRVDGFAIGFTALLLLLAAGVHFLPRMDSPLLDRHAADLAKQPLSPHPLDRLVFLWVACIPCSPLILYIIANMTTLTGDNWRTILGSKVLVCVVLPLIGALPLLRYIRGPAALYALLFAVVGTLFPVAFGLPALADLLGGLRREQVTVTAVRRIVVARQGHGEEATDILDVDLADGRTLQANTRNARLRTLAEGPAMLTFLRYTGSIIEVKDE